MTESLEISLMSYRVRAAQYHTYGTVWDVAVPDGESRQHCAGMGPPLAEWQQSATGQHSCASVDSLIAIQS